MSLKQSTAFGHISALLTALVWGATFISTKILLQTCSPVEILFYRFVVSLLILLILSPRRMRVADRRDEALFAGAGLSGITLYYLLENVALTQTTAFTVGVIVSMAPFFTGLLAGFFLKAERPGIPFYAGFALALTGVALTSWNGSFDGFHPVGDVLALLAAILWAVYSILVKKLSARGYPTLPMTRRIIIYGVVLMVPALFFMDFHPSLSHFTQAGVLPNILFLGVFASAIAFVSWNFSVKRLGAVKCSVYIYLVPVVTTILSVTVLQENVTAVAVVGILLTLGGLALSEFAPARRSPSADKSKIHMEENNMLLEVFFDYSCPYCLEGHEHLKALIGDYPALEVSFVPCEAHPRPDSYGMHSDLCARGFFFARDAGVDLWEYHDRMYQTCHDGHTNIESIDELAPHVEGLLDPELFRDALNRGDYQEELARNNDRAWNTEGLAAVPSYRLGGRALNAVEDVGVSKDLLKRFLSGGER